MQTPDGQWRVDVVRRPGHTSYWYRVTHQDNVIDWLTIGQVQRILADAGIDIATLVEADNGPQPDTRSGAA